MASLGLDELGHFFLDSVDEWGNAVFLPRDTNESGLYVEFLEEIVIEEPAVIIGFDEWGNWHNGYIDEWGRDILSVGQNEEGHWVNEAAPEPPPPVEIIRAYGLDEWGISNDGLLDENGNRVFVDVGLNEDGHWLEYFTPDTIVFGGRVNEFSAPHGGSTDGGAPVDYLEIDVGTFPGAEC